MRHYLTNSERKTYVSCRYLWFLRYLLQITPVAKAPPLIRGTIWHMLMQTYWSCLDVQRTIQWFSQGTYKIIEKNQDLFQFLCRVLIHYDYFWGTENRAFDVFMNEDTISTPCITPNGNESHFHFAMGTIDKGLRDVTLDKRVLADHKMPSKPLSQWEDYNAHNPQAATYIWLGQQQKDFPTPEGIIYDLALAELPPMWTEYRTCANGTKLHKTLPSGATAESFVQAIAMRGFSINDQDWYLPKLRELQSKPPKEYFRRIYSTIPDGELKRIEVELYTVCKEIRLHRMRWADRLEEWQTRSREQDWRETVLSLLREGNVFPRNQYYCRRYARSCEYIDACWYRDPNALGPFYLRKTYHPEHEEES